MTRNLKRESHDPTTDGAAFEQSYTALALHRRDVILEAIAACAKELLRTSDVKQSLPKVIERLGHATGIDRVHIFEVQPTAIADGGQIAWHYMWSAPGIFTPKELAEVKGAMADVGLAAWVPRLARGETIGGAVKDFDDCSREVFKMGDIQSTLAVPVFVDEQWWGFIAFDDCRSEREWFPTEIEAFKMLAELVGAAVGRAKSQQKLADANRIVESSPTILFRLEPEPPFRLTFLSQNIRRYGYEADELLASPISWLQLIESDDLPSVIGQISMIAKGTAGHTRTDFRLRQPDGAKVWFEGEGNPLYDDAGRLIGIEGILSDVTVRKSAAEKIAALARTDALTGLPNRPAFIERLNLALARARRGSAPFAILFLDLDRFKDVNDTLGHPVGDALLRAVADRLKSCVRETDQVARFGGDEFAVLQDEMADIASAEYLATKICEALAAPYSIDGNQVRTTVSIGVVPYNTDIDGADSIMMKADLALYRAKDEGRNQFRFHAAEFDQQVRERVTISADLHEALERGEFELFYQPQVELASGRISGFEALIRWNHPTRGLLLPGTFIPIAETTGSILAIGRWVIEQACRQIALWREMRVPAPIVAVNLSAAQFKLAPYLHQVVAASLAKHLILPGQLELELTESVLMETTQKHSEALEQLRQIGVRLAIDDFGTGYSSLDYLRSFHVSRLKIDRRFVQGITVNADDATIVRATIRLAQELGIEVVAEGVETGEQKQLLMAAGCKFAQGNILSLPLPIDAATSLLMNANVQAAAG